MSSQMQELMKIRTELGYKGLELQAFVKEQQAIARDEREKERALEKEKAELQANIEKVQEETKRAELQASIEKEKANLNHEKELALIEKQKIEILEKGKKDATELEIKMIMTKSEIEETKSENSSIHEDEDNIGSAVLGGG